LRMFAWFAPDPIPLFVLDGEEPLKIWREVTALFAKERRLKLVVNVRLRDSLANLINFSMVKFDQCELLVVHRVVQEILRNRTPQTHRKEWVLGALQLISAAAPREVDDVRTWPQWNPLRPH